jgi:peptidoglycan-N-acetylglucosamine deacetylase
MHQYFIKTPWVVKKLFSSYTWDMPADENNLYLSFDDGPHPEITAWVLDELKKYNATGTFFCIGKNVALYPEVYNRILAEGHVVGNHTYDHLNGWKTKTNAYVENVQQAALKIESNLFRPPYGKITSKQAKEIMALLGERSKIVMWDVLSADFDSKISAEQCADNVIKNASAGSIIVFHDSDKAQKNLVYTLPRVLEHFSRKGFQWKGIF